MAKQQIICKVCHEFGTGDPDGKYICDKCKQKGMAEMCQCGHEVGLHQDGGKGHCTVCGCTGRATSKEAYEMGVATEEELGIDPPMQMDDPQMVRALTIRKALQLYAKTGMQVNRAYTPTAMLRVAGEITGKKYKRGQYTQAADDIWEWVNMQAHRSVAAHRQAARPSWSHLDAMRNTTYNFISDPGHGWLEVPIEHLKQLDIADKISNFSYRKGDMAYLEEDQDASEFIKAYEEYIKMKPKYVEVYQENTPIRGYDTYYGDEGEASYAEKHGMTLLPGGGMVPKQPRFKDTKFMTAAEKEKVLKHWKAFLKSGFKWAKFTNALYDHLYIHQGYIAHYDKGGFHSYYFPNNVAEFLREWDYYKDRTSLDYQDISEAMDEELTKYRR